MPFHIWPTSRREFLSSLVVGGTSLAFGQDVEAAKPEPDAWFALLSDTHIDADPKRLNGQQNMANNLKTVVKDILKVPSKPVGLLINGDIAKLDGQPGDYATLLALLEPIRKAEIPIHFTLGNHDDRSHFRDAMRPLALTSSPVESKYVDSFNALGRRFVMLDSLDQVNHVEGSLGSNQLAWLVSELDLDKTRQTLVFVHHNPISDVAPGLTDHAALFEVLKGRPWVRAIFYGHTHVWAHQKTKELRLINLPPVGYTFAEKQPIGYCRLVVNQGRMKVQLHALAGDRSKDGDTYPIRPDSD